MPKYTSSAKVVDGSLVLSLPDAVTPVVMRLSLEEVRSAAFTVVEKKGQHILTVQFSEKESRDIAPYAEKEEAVAALMSASAALERGSRSGSGDAANESRRTPISAKNAAKWAGAVCVLIFLVWIIGSMNSNMPRVSPSTYPTQPATNNAGAQPQKSSGVPQSADDFLKGRQ